MRGGERWGVNGFGVASEKLCSFVDELGLHDLPLQGFSFTYFRFGQNASRSRIYKFLIFDGAGA